MWGVTSQIRHYDQTGDVLHRKCQIVDNIIIMGKIGKPQKSKKQKKIKHTYDDTHKRPAIQQNKPSLKDLPPDDVDSQEIPRKVKNIMKSQQQMTKKKNKKKLKQQVDSDQFRMERGMSRPLKPAPRFVQGKRETDDHFLRRVSLETHRVLMKAQIEDKYKVDITESGSGRTTIKKQKTETKKQKERDRKKKKKEALKERRLDRQGDFSHFTDPVKFGEVAMEPPSLTAQPRKAALDKPGRKSLLLSKYMDDTVVTENPSSAELSSNTSKTFVKREMGKTLKRKFLSPAQQRITDSQRQRAIDLYRKMKDRKLKQR